MDAQVLGNGTVDQVEEPPELLGSVPRRHVGDDVARRQVQRCVQVGGAIADVVVGPPFSDAGEQRQDRVRSKAWI